jgi:hypothetical protein
MKPLLFFQVAPHLSSQGLSGPRSKPSDTQKIWWLRESNPGHQNTKSDSADALSLQPEQSALHSHIIYISLIITIEGHYYNYVTTSCFLSLSRRTYARADVCPSKQCI